MTPAEQDERLARFERRIEETYREVTKKGWTHAEWVASNMKVFREIEEIPFHDAAWLGRMKQTFEALAERLAPRH